MMAAHAANRLVSSFCATEINAKLLSSGYVRAAEDCQSDRRSRQHDHERLENRTRIQGNQVRTGPGQSCGDINQRCDRLLDREQIAP